MRTVLKFLTVNLSRFGLAGDIHFNADTEVNGMRNERYFEKLQISQKKFTVTRSNYQLTFLDVDSTGLHIVGYSLTIRASKLTYCPVFAASESAVTPFYFL